MIGVLRQARELRAAARAAIINNVQQSLSYALCNERGVIRKVAR